MKAHELISDPRRFTTGALARDRKGVSVGTLPDSGAVKFDALGAIFWCYPAGAHKVPDQESGKSPCQKARELSHLRFDRPLGKLDWREALAVLREADV